MLNGIKNKFLFVISGPSGVGKSTICNLILASLDNLQYSISFTTRKSKKNEKHSINYFFILEDEFKKMIKNDDFLEWAYVYKNYYGTSKTKINEIFKNKKDAILDIDIQGALKLKNKLKDRAVLIFLTPPSSNELKKRLENRARDSLKEQIDRFKEFDNEIENIKDYDYIVCNNKVADTIEVVKAIILSVRHKVIK